MKLQLFVIALMFSSACLGWSKQEVQKNIQDFRGHIKEDMIDLKQKEKNLIRVIKIWRAQKLNDLKKDYEQDLRLLNQEFSIKIDSLGQIQRMRTNQHQALVEKTFLRSIELKEEKFLKKKEMTDDYFSSVAEVEKDYMDKYHDIAREFAKKRRSNLNNRYPAFFPAQEEVRKDPWLSEQFCHQQVFYAKEQAKMDHKTYLFDLTVPMRKKREEAEVRYKIARDELQFYRNTYSSLQALSKHLKKSGVDLDSYKEKLDASQKVFYVAEAQLERLKKTIKEVAFNLKQEKSRRKLSCDPTKPIGKIKIKD